MKRPKNQKHESDSVESKRENPTIDVSNDTSESIIQRRKDEMKKPKKQKRGSKSRESKKGHHSRSDDGSKSKNPSRKKRMKKPKKPKRESNSIKSKKGHSSIDRSDDASESEDHSVKNEIKKPKKKRSDSHSRESNKRHHDGSKSKTRSRKDRIKKPKKQKRDRKFAESKRGHRSWSDDAPEPETKSKKHGKKKRKKHKHGNSTNSDITSNGPFFDEPRKKSHENESAGLHHSSSLDFLEIMPINSSENLNTPSSNEKNEEATEVERINNNCFQGHRLIPRSGLNKSQPVSIDLPVKPEKRSFQATNSAAILSNYLDDFKNHLSRYIAVNHDKELPVPEFPQQDTEQNMLRRPWYGFNFSRKNASNM
ncbi:hypothetical protein Ciccas_014001 [Cichlidogyrus casuarinus]|uniref:Uncharacterized protein n=1 Tax=Cichlidogyrus casuarinus TaxID=1844966 RepID=A0ABD2PLE0_9PLAT